MDYNVKALQRILAVIIAINGLLLSQVLLHQVGWMTVVGLSATIIGLLFSYLPISSMKEHEQWLQSELREREDA